VRIEIDTVCSSCRLAALHGFIMYRDKFTSFHCMCANNNAEVALNNKTILKSYALKCPHTRPVTRKKSRLSSKTE